MRLGTLCALACLLVGCTTPQKTPVANFLEIAAASGYEFAPVSPEEQSFIGTFLSPSSQSPLTSVVLMKSGDRVAAVWWQAWENPTAQLSALKRSIFPLLSERADDIIDETDVFSFSDTQISEEKLLFATTENLLLEFHMHKDVQILMEMLTLRLRSAEQNPEPSSEE